MQKKQYRKELVRQFYARSHKPTEGDKRFIKILWPLTGFLALSAFLIIITDNIIVFGSLFYLIGCAMVIILIISLIYRYQDITKNLRQGQQEEHGADR